MKILFVEARKKTARKKTENFMGLKKKKLGLEKLPKKIGLLCSLQYLDDMKKIASLLEKKGKKVFLAKGKIAEYKGQVLGCDIGAAKKIENKVDAFLLVSSGEFHLLQLALNVNKPIFILTSEIKKVSKNEIKKLKQKKTARIKKFLSAEKIGILISIKPGQQNFPLALKLKKILEKQGKKVSLFLANEINNEMENFSCKAWLNLACPGLIFDVPSNTLVNYEEIKKYL